MFQSQNSICFIILFLLIIYLVLTTIIIKIVFSPNFLKNKLRFSLNILHEDLEPFLVIGVFLRITLVFQKQSRCSYELWYTYKTTCGNSYTTIKNFLNSKQRLILLCMKITLTPSIVNIDIVNITNHDELIGVLLG